MRKEKTEAAARKRAKRVRKGQGPAELKRKAAHAKAIEHAYDAGFRAAIEAEVEVESDDPPDWIETAEDYVPG